MPAELAKRFHNRSVHRLKRAYKIGVTLAFGSDLIFFAEDETRGTWTISQIDSFVEAGIPPRAMPVGADHQRGPVLGVEKNRGAIKPGLFADIIATPESHSTISTR